MKPPKEPWKRALLTYPARQVVTELLHMLRIQCYDRKKLEERLERDKNSRLHGVKVSMSVMARSRKSKRNA